MAAEKRAVSSVVERLVYTQFQEYFHSSAFSPRDSIKTRFLEEKQLCSALSQLPLTLSHNHMRSITWKIESFYARARDASP